MNAKTLWQIGGVLGFLVIIAAGWFLLVSQVFGSIDTNDRLRRDVEAQNAALQSAIAAMADVDVAQLQTRLDSLEKAVPAKVDEPEMLREIRVAAEMAGVTLNAVNFQTATLFAPGGPPASPGEEEDATAPGGDAPLPIDPADLQAVADAGLLVVPLTIQVTSTLAAGLEFADLLQHSDRLFLVYRVGASPGAEGSAESADDGEGALSTTASIDALAFVLPPKAPVAR